MQIDIIETIVYLAGNLFHMYIISLFFQVFFNKAAFGKRKAVRILCYSLYFCVNSMGFLYFDWHPQIIIFTNVLGTSLVSATYAGTWKFRICAIVMGVTINIICEDVVFYLLINLHVQHMIIIGIITANLFSFIVVVLLQKFVDLKKGEDISILEWLSVTIIPLCSLFISAIVLDDCKDEIAIAVGGISMALINIFLFFLLDRIQKVYRAQLDITLLEQQNQAYENQMLLSKVSEEKIAALRHDIKNHFLALQHLAKQDNCIEIRKYLNSLVPLVEVQGNFASTGNPMIDSFLNMKLGEAAEYGADIRVDLKISKEIPISSRDISILLGNLLDNALRALKHCNKKEKALNVVMRQEPGKLFIQVDNTHNEAMRKSGNTFKTTKENRMGHGIGLKNVKRVVTIYQGEMEIKYTEDHFSVKLVIFLQ